MKSLWQLTYDELSTGALALSRCPRCHGQGVCTQTVLRHSGDDLVEVDQPLACDCRERALGFLAAAHLPGRRFETATLGSLDWSAIQPARTVAALQLYAERFEEMLDHGIGLAMTGSVGTGKTHVAVGLVRLACGLGIEARFYSLPDLLARVKATYGPRGEAGHRRSRGESEADVLDELAAVPLLVLDDLGVEQPSDWVRDRLYTLVNRRYTTQRPTLTTSNENLPLLARRLGQRVVSRLAGASLEVIFEGEDYRTRTRDRLLEELGMGWADVWVRAG
jgi:DNA replication protein DnaC